MATGFMVLQAIARAISVAALLVTAAYSYSADIAVTALFNGKAVLVVDNGKPRTLSAGQTTPEGVKLVNASSESAVIEYAGKRQTLLLGQGTRVGASAPERSSGEVKLTADSGGHFFANGWINGSTVRFMVDTGASAIALSTDEARRLGVNYLSAPRGFAQTANGKVPIYAVKLDTVRVGEITLNNVEAIVADGAGLNVALLGMSFLNRMQMRRDGDTLTLLRRY